MSDDELARALPWRELTEQREERLSLLRLSRNIVQMRAESSLLGYAECSRYSTKVNRDGRRRRQDEDKTKAKPTLFLHKGEDVDIICVGQCIGIQAEGYGSRPLVKHESR